MGIRFLSPLRLRPAFFPEIKHGISSIASNPHYDGGWDARQIARVIAVLQFTFFNSGPGRQPPSKHLIKTQQDQT